MDKQAGVPTGATAGSTIDYSFVVTNTGNVTLDSVSAIADPKTGPVSCPVTVLAPGASTTCTATYTLTQADVDAGHVANTATVTGTPPVTPGNPTPTPVTATDSTDTPIAAGPVITVDKQAGVPTGATAGSTIDYTFVVTNTGNVTLDPISVSDAKVGTVTCPVTVLAPGADTTCTATYTLTQADVDAGEVVNTATASGTPPTGPPTTAEDTVTTPIPAAPVVTVDKQAGVPTGATAGSTIDYSFVVTNTGNVTLDSVSIADPKTGPVSCPVTVLAPGASTTCTATYTLTQADVDAGHVANTATVTGTPPVTPGNPTPTPVTATDSTDTPITAGPAITLDKQAGVPTGATAGSTIDYTFLVTNTGNVTLDPISVSDAKVGTVTCPVTVLAPGASTTCTATYTLTQADVDAGEVLNTATATGTDPNGTDVTAEDTVTTPIPAAPVITVDKQAGVPTGATAGSTIDYSFVVTNTGNVTLDSISIDDPKTGPVSCPVTVLAPGASTTCTATYTLTQADVDAGHVANTATVTGTPPVTPGNPTPTPVTAEDSTDTPIAAGPAITLDKQAGVPTGNSAGSTIDYTFVVTNTGNVTLDPISVSDAKVGTVTCPVTVLAPGASTTCTATYTLTQADVDAGEVLNTATATGTDPNGTDVTAEDTVTTPIPAAPVITLDKQAGVPTGATAGSTIDYSFVVTNTGNVTLDSVSIADPKTGPVSCPVTVLAPGESTTCTATYTLTQADVDAGHVANTATASGTPPVTLGNPTPTPVTATDSTDTPITAGPAITLDKQAGTPTGNSAGSTIDYTFLVTNTGNVTLDPISVTDAKVGTVTCPVTVLAPGASTTCTATYTLTQADVDAGEVVNTATASGTPPTGPPTTGEDTVTTPIPAAPVITVDKQAGVPTGATAGSTIDYSFVVTNTGNVTLDSVSIADPKTGPVSCPVTVLAPGESTTCTATYTLTQADVDAGHVANTATATGTDPNGTDVTAEDSTDTPITAGPAITVDKQAGTPTGATAGSTIDYTFLVTNTGNVTLDPISVSDAKVGTVTCPVTVLAPGASTTCTATYTLTQADVDAGEVVNTATASGTPPTGPPTTGEDTVTTPIPAAPVITVDKQAGVPTGATAGSTIDYSFLVTNTGNVTLDSISIADLKTGPVSCPVTVLAPGESTTCTATYTLTQADVDAGHVANTATVSGTQPVTPGNPTPTPVTATDSTDTPITAGPAITLDKQAEAIVDIDSNGPDAGDTIDFAFIVTNTGNVTLDPVSVDDPKVGTVTCPVTVLAPGESTTCSATYTLTQADVDAGHVANTATATGTDPNGTDVTAEDSTDTTIPAGPAITLDKQAGTPTGERVGDTIDYTFVVTNTGNVTLDSVSVDDPKVGTVTCPVSVLAPGASTTCSATYTLTQADVDAGEVVNVATATGIDPTNTDVSAEDTTTTPLAPAPVITLDKQAGVPSGANAGDTIAYTFLVTNTGNVTLSDVSLDDPKVGAVTCPVTTLAPLASMTCTATYTLSQADVDAGEVLNVATVTGTDPNGTDASAEDSTTTLLPPAPAITLDKQAGEVIDGDGNGVDVGDTIDYAFLVTNTGNVTLDPISVDDPTTGPVTCPVTVLAPGESTTCTATYTLTQDDVDAGTVHNEATASGTDPNGTEVIATDVVDTPIEPNPSILLEKVADTAGPVAAGDQVTFSFTVTNTGNVTLTNVRVIDPMVGTVTCATTTLAPGESTTCTAAPYTVTAKDVRNGSIVNQATARGNGGGGAEVSSQDVVQVSTSAPPKPSIKLVKKANTDGPVKAGQKITYTFVVTNTGNVALTKVKVSDPMVGAVVCPKTSLKPGQSMMCEAKNVYTVTKADVQNGDLVNHAKTTGRYCPADGGACTSVSDRDALSIPTQPSGGLPNTGSPVRPQLILLALGLLSAGGFLLFAGRRRRA